MASSIFRSSPRIRQRTRTWLAAAVFVVVFAVTGTGSAAAGVDASRFLDTPDGLHIEVRESDTSIQSVPPLDSSPLSREAFIDGGHTGEISGPAGTKITGAVFEAGYQIGYPVLFAPDGIDVELKTPDLSVNAGVNASVGPSIQVGPLGPSGGGSFTLGANAGATSTLIPAQSLKFKVKYGDIRDVPLAQVQLGSPVAYAGFGGVHLKVAGALGPVTVRPYTRMSMTTATGQYSVVTYGRAIQL